MNNDESIKREYPERPIASVAAYILKGDRILVIQRGTPPDQGMLTVPGGMIELGETIKETTKREIKEECDIEIEVGDVFDIANRIFPDEKRDIQFHYIVICVLASHKNGEATAGSYAQDLKWVCAQELDNIDIPPTVRENIIKAFKLTGITV